jgi:hypothetical protein
MFIPVQKLKRRFVMRSFACVAVLACLFFSSPLRAADNASPKNAQAILNEMRMRQLTKSLELTEDQQKKMKALYDEEAKQIKAANDDENLTLMERRQKTQAITKATREKIKPLLTEEQNKKWDEQIAKQNQPRKKNPAAAPAPAPADPAKTPAAP